MTRDVRIVRPSGWWSSRGASALWGLDPRWAALRYGSLTAMGLVFLSWAWPGLSNWPAFLAGLRALLAEMDDNAGIGVVAIIVLLWSIVIIGAAVQFARVLPDVVGRKTVDGRVVHWEIIEGHHSGGEDPSTPDTYWIAVDDGRSDTVPAYKVNPAVMGSVKLGDHVRLTVGPLHGFVFKAALLDPSTGRAGRIGATPELAGAPVGARELGRAFHRTVRSVEGPAESLGGKVRTWTYQLGYGTSVERESYVRVHLASGTDGFVALAGPQNRDAPPKRTWLERLAERNVASGRGWSPDYDWWDFGDLLIVRKGEFVIGFEQARGMDLLKWHANASLRLALGALRRLPVRRV
jgi:hypothetical protein